MIGIEADADNMRKAEPKLAPYANVELIAAAVADTEGTCTFHPASWHGSHSLLEVVETSPHSDFPRRNLEPVEVASVTIDGICSARGIDTLDVLKMDIQGGELMALRGAARLLAAGAIRVIALEVLFREPYRGQPFFWDTAAFLRQYGYELQGLYDERYHETNRAVLRWADAIFVSPRMRAL